MSEVSNAELIKAAAGKVAAHLGGYAAVWTIDLGLRSGLFQALRDESAGLTARELASRIHGDDLYVDVWCRNAYAAELLELNDDRYVLPQAVATVLLDRDHPAYAAGTTMVFTGLRDVFVDLRQRMKTGERIWWDTAPREFVDAGAESSRPFYSRLMVFIEQREELRKALEAGGTLLEVGVGYGSGLLRIAQKFRAARVVGIDGDTHSLAQAQKAFADAGIADRARFVRSAFEDYAEKAVADIALINISLHEARDIKRTVASLHGALRPGGWMVVSEFPYPAAVAGLRTPPARVMTAIQYFEASINDQLLPTAAFVALLEQAGLKDVGAVELTPVHVVIVGRQP